MADYLALSEGNLIAWFQNFAAKLALHQPALASITAADVTQAAADAVTLENAVATVVAIRSDKKEYTQVKDLLLHGPTGTVLPTAPTATAWPAYGLGADAAIIARTRLVAGRCKADAGYTTAIGQDLGIVGTGDAASDAVPTMTGSTLVGYQVEIKWAKAGHDAVQVQSQRASEAVWADLAVDTVSPYIDTRAPLVASTPEERRYRAAYMDDDAITSGWSDTLVVTAQS